MYLRATCNGKRNKGAVSLRVCQTSGSIVVSIAARGRARDNDEGETTTTTTTTMTPLPEKIAFVSIIARTRAACFRSVDRNKLARARARVPETQTGNATSVPANVPRTCTISDERKIAPWICCVTLHDGSGRDGFSVRGDCSILPRRLQSHDGNKSRQWQTCRADPDDSKRTLVHTYLRLLESLQINEFYSSPLKSLAV